MMRARGLKGWFTIAALALACVGLLRITGHLDSLEFAFADTRARLLQHEVASDILIVGIDAHSLTRLRQWPWPRRHHAELLKRIKPAAPRRVFFDIDFSSASNSEDDSRLAEALSAWPGSPVLLPVLFQQLSGTDTGLSVSTPIAEFARYTSPVAVNLAQGTDGKVREVPLSWNVEGQRYLTMAGMVHETEAATDLPIDFSISPSSFEYVSYSDVLDGRVAPDVFNDKIVYVGAFAVELGDMVSVPIHQRLPGVVVQALGAQTAALGPLRQLPRIYDLAFFASLGLLAAFAFSDKGWRTTVGWLAASALALAAISVYAYANHRLILEVMPYVAVLVVTFLFTTLRSLDEQTWRAFMHALGIRHRDAMIHSIVESSTDGILSIDAQGAIRTANSAVGRMFGYPVERIMGASLSKLMPAIEDARRLANWANGANASSLHEAMGIMADGTTLPVELAVSTVDLADERLYTVVVRDITERKRHEAQLEYQATHDPLTSLPNRTALNTELERALITVATRNSVGLLMLDLCRFKEVNDTLGHGVGDQVLCEVARRFLAVLDDRGLLARIGGDEFTIVLRSITDRSAAASLACELSDCLREPIAAGGVAIEVGLSVGIALYPENAQNAEGLLRHADVAMYGAKRRGAVWEYYDPDDDQHSIRRLTMVTELRAAIATDQIQLWYQPQVNLQNGRIESMEALVRWNHPTLGAVSPGEFIAVAESTDLIPVLTDWTLRKALEQIAEWRQRGLRLRIAVNLSARMLQDVVFPNRLRELLDASGVPPDSLELEITESAMMIDPARALKVAHEIHGTGVVVAIDDYGTGFSSLSYLRDLPVHALKLDKSFVLDLEINDDNRAIAESTVRMAHALRLKVVAEGVETQWIADYLAAIGYDYAQGYRYSPALAARDVEPWICRFNELAATTQAQGVATSG